MLAVSGCGQTRGVQGFSTLRSVPVETAFVLPPPGGPSIVGVVQRNYINATQQDIALSTSAHTPGQNLLRVQFFGPVDPAEAGQSSLRDRPLSWTDIWSEMNKQMSGVPMKRSPYYVQNSYGPFGYAIGRSRSGDGCIFAWQRLRAPHSSSQMIRNRGTIQLRLRYCETGAGEDRLLSLMYGFSINAAIAGMNWNPYGAPAPLQEGFGRPGAPIYPQVTAPARPAAEALAEPAPPRRPRAPAAAEVRPAPLPAPIGPMVPPPPDQSAADSSAIPAPPPCEPSGGATDTPCK